MSEAYTVDELFGTVAVNFTLEAVKFISDGEGLAGVVSAGALPVLVEARLRSHWHRHVR